MAIQSQGVRTTTSTPATAVYGIYPGPTARAALLEMIYIQTSASALNLGLGRPATIGTPNSPVLFQQDDPSDPAGIVNGHVTWFAQPTAPTVFHRRWTAVATAGIGFVWTFPRGLIATSAAPMVLWGISGPVPADLSVTIDA